MAPKKNAPAAKAAKKAEAPTPKERAGSTNSSASGPASPSSIAAAKARVSQTVDRGVGASPPPSPALQPRANETAAEKRKREAMEAQNAAQRTLVERIEREDALLATNLAALRLSEVFDRLIPHKKFKVRGPPGGQREFDWTKILEVLRQRDAKSPRWFIQIRSEDLLLEPSGTDGETVDCFIVLECDVPTLAPLHYVAREHPPYSDIEDNAPESIFMLSGQRVCWRKMVLDDGKDINCYILAERPAGVAIGSAAASAPGATSTNVPQFGFGGGDDPLGGSKSNGGKLPFTFGKPNDGPNATPAFGFGAGVTLSGTSFASSSTKTTNTAPNEAKPENPFKFNAPGGSATGGFGFAAKAAAAAVAKAATPAPDTAAPPAKSAAPPPRSGFAPPPGLLNTAPRQEKAAAPPAASVPIQRTLSGAADKPPLPTAPATFGFRNPGAPQQTGAAPRPAVPASGATAAKPFSFGAKAAAQPIRAAVEAEASDDDEEQDEGDEEEDEEEMTEAEQLLELAASLSSIDGLREGFQADPQSVMEQIAEQDPHLHSLIKAHYQFARALMTNGPSDALLKRVGLTREELEAAINGDDEGEEDEDDDEEVDASEEEEETAPQPPKLPVGFGAFGAQASGANAKAAAAAPQQPAAKATGFVFGAAKQPPSTTSAATATAPAAAAQPQKAASFGFGFGAAKQQSAPGVQTPAPAAQEAPPQKAPSASFGFGFGKQPSATAATPAAAAPAAPTAAKDAPPQKTPSGFGFGFGKEPSGVKPSTSSAGAPAAAAVTTYQPKVQKLKPGEIFFTLWDVKRLKSMKKELHSGYRIVTEMTLPDYPIEGFASAKRGPKKVKIAMQNDLHDDPDETAADVILNKLFAKECAEVKAVDGWIENMPGYDPAVAEAVQAWREAQLREAARLKPAKKPKRADSDDDDDSASSSDDEVEARKSDKKVTTAQPKKKAPRKEESNDDDTDGDDDAPVDRAGFDDDGFAPGASGDDSDDEDASETSASEEGSAADAEEKDDGSPAAEGSFKWFKQRYHALIANELRRIVAIRKQRVAEQDARIEEALMLLRDKLLAPKSAFRVLKYYPSNDVLKFRPFGKVTGISEVGEHADECYPPMYVFHNPLLKK